MPIPALYQMPPPLPPLWRLSGATCTAGDGPPLCCLPPHPSGAGASALLTSLALGLEPPRPAPPCPPEQMVVGHLLPCTLVLILELRSRRAYLLRRRRQHRIVGLDHELVPPPE